MREVRVLNMVILWISVSTAEAEQQHPSPFDTAGLAAYIATVSRVGQLPVVATAVVTPDGPIFEAISELDRSDTEPGSAVAEPNAGRRFSLGSVSEMLIAFALLRLVDAGRIDPNAPVRRYLPDLAFADLARTEALTVRHLLTHRSGLPAMPYFSRRVQLYGRLDHIRFAGDPGSRLEPSGLNHLVLGRMLEAVSGEPLGLYISRSVLQPLGIRSLGPDGQPAQGEVQVPGHSYLFGWPVAGIGRTDTRGMPPTPQLTLSAQELARFLSVLLNDGIHEGQRLLSSAGVESLLPPGAPTVDAAYQNVWAQGWKRVAKAGPSAWYREAATPGHHALIAVYPAQGLGIIVLASRTGGPGPNAVRSILDGILDHIEGKAPRPYFPWELILHATLFFIVLWLLVRPIRWHRLWREAGSPSATAHTPTIVIGLAAELALAAAVPLVVVLGVAKASLSWLLALYPDVGVALLVFPVTVVPTAVWRCLVRSEIWRRSQVSTPVRRS